MKVYLNELSETPKDLHFSERDPWLVETVRGTEEVAIKSPAYVVDFELRKTQDVVFLKSRLKLTVGLLCSRCANEFLYLLASSFQCMFTRDRGLENEHKATTGVAHSEPTGATGEDLDIEFLEKDYIELSDVLKEQIYLKIPFQPLCHDDCKGICPVCGQNQNTHPCQCHRLKSTAMANALKNVRIS